jgi:hypothetical protein
MHQTTLTDNPDDEPGDTTTTELATPSSDNQMNLAPPDQRGGDDCCPWCLASSESFEQHGDGRPRCGHCDAAIPVGVPWFERGEKIVV